MTKEDSEAAGLKADKSTYFYDSYVDDSRLSERQSKGVTYNKKIPLDGDLTSDNIKGLIVDIGFMTASDLQDLDMGRVVESINSPEDPYS